MKKKNAARVHSTSLYIPLIYIGYSSFETTEWVFAEQYEKARWEFFLKKSLKLLYVDLFWA